jgi:hypothetical protein
VITSYTESTDKYLKQERKILKRANFIADVYNFFGMSSEHITQLYNKTSQRCDELFALNGGWVNRENSKLRQALLNKQTDVLARSAS